MLPAPEKSRVRSLGQMPRSAACSLRTSWSRLTTEKEGQSPYFDQRQGRAESDIHRE
jgi:hypothetical protein